MSLNNASSQTLEAYGTCSLQNRGAQNHHFLEEIPTRIKLQFYVSFQRLISFCPKKLPWTLQKVQYQFSTIELHFVRKSCPGHFKIAILRKFSTIELHFVRKSCPGHLKIAILRKFSAIELHFVRRSCRGHFKKWKFISVFDDRTSFRAKRLHFVAPRRRCSPA